jgi:hypothetical protein
MSNSMGLIYTTNRAHAKFSLQVSPPPRAAELRTSNYARMLTSRLLGPTEFHDTS